MTKAIAADLWRALDEMLNYAGGADNALEDEYVVERTREILDAYAPLFKDE